MEPSPTDWADAYRDPEVAAVYDRRYHGPIRRLSNEGVWRAVRAGLLDLGGGQIPAWVVDAPSGTGRFSDRLQQLGCRVIHLDRSPQMLKRARFKHPGADFVVGDLHQPPLSACKDCAVLCLRLMQHLNRPQRIAALRGLRSIAPAAVVGYYPGWDWKNRLRRIRHRVGLRARIVREYISWSSLRSEIESAGWRLVAHRRVAPLLSENLILTLQASR